MKFVVDANIPYIKGVLEPFAEVVYLPGKEISRDVVKDADALIVRTRTKCNESLLAGSSVRAVFTATIGFDHIDTAYCEANGIHWQSAPGCNSSSVQQYVASALASMHLNGVVSISGATIAVVGVGNVGSKVADWCQKLGMRVLKVDPFKKVQNPDEYVEYHDALAQADIVTFHTPLTREGDFPTYHLFGDDALSLLKYGAVVINTSRGEVCSTSTLLKGLDSGRISRTVIDVWENEPDVNVDLMRKSYVSTPHVAGYSYDSKRNGTEMSVRALSEFFGLGLSVFVSGNLPDPDNREFVVGPSSSDIDAACRLFVHTYNIEGESDYFKSHPQEFEYYRGNYPLRREIGAFELVGNSSCSAFLSMFGVKCPR